VANTLQIVVYGAEAYAESEQLHTNHEVDDILATGTRSGCLLEVQNC